MPQFLHPHSQSWVKTPLRCFARWFPVYRGGRPGYTCNNGASSQCGVTLLELLVAITISGIVMTLGFTMYGYVTKKFTQQTRVVERLRATMLAQKRIEHTVGRITTLVRSTEREVCGIDGDLDSMIICRFSGTALLANGDTVAKGLGSFRFSIVDGTSRADKNRSVLLWDAELAASGDWIGGAVALKK